MGCASRIIDLTAKAIMRVKPHHRTASRKRWQQRKGLARSLELHKRAKNLEVNGSQRHDCLPQGNDTTVNPEVCNALDKQERYTRIYRLRSPIVNRKTSNVCMRIEWDAKCVTVRDGQATILPVQQKSYPVHDS